MLSVDGSSFLRRVAEYVAFMVALKESHGGLTPGLSVKVWQPAMLRKAIVLNCTRRAVFFLHRSYRDISSGISFTRGLDVHLAMCSG